jgi:hypothetical protein
MLANVISEVSTGQQVHHEIQIFSILKSIVHVDYERIVELCKNLPFVHNGFYASLGDNTGLGHLFHRVRLLGLLTLHFPDLAETTFTNAV